MTRILVVAIHGPYEPWLSILRNGQRKTWMNQSDSIRVVNAFGRPISEKLKNFDQEIYYLRWNTHKLIAYTALGIEALVKKLIRLYKFSPRIQIVITEEFGEVWEIQMPDSLMLQGVKNLTVLRESLNFEYEFLVTTITSSYLNTRKLKSFLSGVNAENFAAGRIEKSGNMAYQQGSFRVYSRDVVERIVASAKRYQHWKIEDIAMGRLVNHLGIDLTDAPNLTLSSVDEASAADMSSLENSVSIRCKCQVDQKRFDQEIMKKIHERLFDSDTFQHGVE